MNGNMNLGKRVTALEKDGGSDIKKEISDLQEAVTTAQNEIDALESKLNSLNVYSAEEKVVGRWIDNKNIYQKVIPFISSLQSNAWVDTPESLENKELIIQTFGVGEALCVPLTGSTDSNASNYVRVWNMRSAACNITHVIIQYTKTE